MNDKELLEKLILEQNESYSTIGKMFGVSGNAIKKRAKRLGIKLPRRRMINEKENFSHNHRSVNSKVNSVDDVKFIEYITTSKTWKELGIKLGYKSKVLSSNVKDSIIERCSMLGMELDFQKLNDVSYKTKGELFKSRKNWQSASSAIRKDARRIFFEENPKPVCNICGYQHHIDVAHIKAVSDFDDDTLISEINSIENLIALCPNHHWEYDNGILQL